MLVDNEKLHRTPRLLLLIAWLVVVIPAAWGVSQTVLRSLDLFKAAPQASSGLTTSPETSVKR